MFCYSNQTSPVSDESLTIRRLPVRNPYAQKQVDGSYLYTHASGQINRYWSRSSLLKRGWSKEEIAKRLGDADVTTTNPYNVNSPSMELFLASDVELLEFYLGMSVLKVEDAIERGDVEQGIKIEINSIAAAGVYTSNGCGMWIPSQRNKNQNIVTTNQMMFLFHEGFPIWVLRR